MLTVVALLSLLLVLLLHCVHMATKCDFPLVQPTGLSNGSYADVDEAV